MSENILMCKIAHVSTDLCVILTNSVRNVHLETTYKTIDAKIAHSQLKLCVNLMFRGLPLITYAYFPDF